MNDISKVINDAVISYDKASPPLKYLLKIAAAVGAFCTNPMIGTVVNGIDTSLSLKALKIHNDRLEGTLYQLSGRLALLKLEFDLYKDFVESELFLDEFRRGMEIATRTASEKKREWVANYLSGVIEHRSFPDIQGQLLEDLNSLQEFHLQVLATLPDKVGAQVQKSEQLSNMPDFIFEKAISDLERFGFIRFHHISAFNGGVNSRNITEYLVKFKKILNLNE